MRTIYFQASTTIFATKKRVLCNQKRHQPTTQFQTNQQPTTNNKLLNKSFRSFPSHFLPLQLNPTQQPTSLRKTHHSHSIHSFHSFIHSSSFTINLYIPFNQQHFVVKFHPFLNQTNNQPTSQQPNPPIHQFINSSNSSNSTTNISPFQLIFQQHTFL